MKAVSPQSHNTASPPPATLEPWLAREGLPFYITPTVFGLLCWFAGWQICASIFFLLAIAVALFFRNPRRTIPSDPTLLISPADGTILSVSEPEATGAKNTDSKIAGQRSRRICIFLSVLNVHVNRYPCNGSVETVNYNPGKFLAAFNEKASLDNEQQATLIDLTDGFKVLVIQIAGLIARRIVCYATPNQTVARGQLMGLIRFGSRVDIWIPAEWEVMVQPQQKVKGGESALARMVRP